MYRYEDIRFVHLELTDKCNAGCPLCGRYQSDGVTLNTQLPLTDLRLDDIKKVFPVDFVIRLKEIKICGNYGDAIMAKDTLEICRWFRTINSTLKINLWTNASARNTAWWTELAEIISPEGYVVFSIDGLEDTNHIYRRNTVWSKIMHSAESFIAAGGNAYWMIIVFEHNEHQIEEARALAKEMGFLGFVVKKSRRFIPTNRRHDVPINPPTRQEYVSDLEKVLPLIHSKYGSLQEFKKKTHIQCLAIETNGIYVSASGHVFPCCWIGYHQWDGTNILSNLDRVDGKQHHMKSIIEGGFFMDIEKTWTKEDERLRVCVKNCGTENLSAHQKINEKF